jgi:nucleoside-diphosphate-sugar epimerase
VILRPFSIYGPFESATRLVPTAIRRALDGKPLPLTRGRFVRDFVFVDDVVDACLLAADRAGIDGETFNVGTGTETSNQEVVAVVEKVLGCRIDVDLGGYEAHASDTHCWRADPTKAREKLSWQASVSFEEGVHRTVDFQRELNEPS